MKYELVCQKCKRCYPPKSGFYVCPDCKSQLKIRYFDQAVNFDNNNNLSGVFRYWSKLPLEEECFITMGEGATPTFLVDHDYLSGSEIWIKNESLNPTGTYKDRPASVAVTKAKELGAKGVVVASDGNAAPAVAAYAAKGDLPCVVLMPQRTPELRYLQAGAYGAKIILIDGDINDCLDIARDLSEKIFYHNCCTSNTVNPYQIEGNKTISFELFEKLGFLPDWVSVPVGGGGLLSAMVKGFLELKISGKIEGIPKILAVQAERCAPLVKAFSGDGIVRKIEMVQDTVALTIALPYPPDGAMALDYLQKSNGFAISVSEDEIIKGVFDLSKNHGVLAEPSGAVSYSGLKKAIITQIIKPGEKCVAIITGTGLKSIDVFRGGLNDIRFCKADLKQVLEELE
jgi:threonine synthase